MFYKSKGKLVVGRNWIIVRVDQNIVNYYKSLLPKYKTFFPQGRPAHITVSRIDIENPIIPKNLKSGLDISFEYGTIVQCPFYYWLDVWSDDICRIREQCELPKYRIGFDRFHITIGRKFEAYDESR